MSDATIASVVLCITKKTELSSIAPPPPQRRIASKRETQLVNQFVGLHEKLGQAEINLAKDGVSFTHGEEKVTLDPGDLATLHASVNRVALLVKVQGERQSLSAKKISL